MSSKFFHGSSVLLGDNTVPGVQLSKELKELIPKVLQSCRDWGLDFYPTVVQLLTYDEISEIAAYGGFPVRFPHWSFGMEYEELQRGYEYGMHKIYEMVINCCELAAPVLTKRGTVAAGFVRVGDDVIVGNDTRKVIAVKRQKASKTNRICLKNGQSLVCTPNHKWRVLSGNGLIWKETAEIAAGDLLIGSDAFESTWDAPKLEWSPKFVLEQTNANVRARLKDISPPKVMTLELAELLGVLTGDGSVGVQGAENYLSVAIDKKSDVYAQHVADLFYQVFGIEASIYEKPACLSVTLSSKYAVDFVNFLGLEKGVTHKDKKIPEVIWSSPPALRAAYLRGLFDTDGYVSQYVGFSCYNKQLAADVQIMLTEMGIQTAYTMEKNGVGKSGDQKNIHVVELRGIWADQKFLQRIGFALQYKKDALETRCGRRFCRNGGPHLASVQNELVSWAKESGITTYSNSTLGYSLKRFQKQEVGCNALSSFVQRAERDGFKLPTNIKELLSNPVFEVKAVVEGDVVETVDIALDHDAHDFVAYGMVTHNTNPCYIYNLASNTLVDHLTVVAHATGHNDFFKNNIHFSATDTNMLNKMANHGTRIRNYMARWGKERVIEFIDHVMRLETLIDGAEAWNEKQVKELNIRDQRSYHKPRRLSVSKDRMYMEPFLNTVEFRRRENERVHEQDIAEEICVFKQPTKNILGFLRDNAPLKPWQADIISMLYEESMYFFPQRQTKVLNEGWASMTDSVIMAEMGLIGLGQKSDDCGIVEYAAHKMGVLGGKYSTNPYKLGYYLLQDIRERWDKGQFGNEYEDCEDLIKKEKWNIPTNKGKEKIFEVRKYYDDLTFIHEFFTEEFCRKQEYFYWKKFPNGEVRLENRDYKKIKDSIMRRHLNGGLPDIKLTEPNFGGRGVMMLQHEFDGRGLYGPYIGHVLNSIRYLWNNDVVLATTTEKGKEQIYYCTGVDERDVRLVDRDKFAL